MISSLVRIQSIIVIVLGAAFLIFAADMLFNSEPAYSMTRRECRRAGGTVIKGTSNGKLCVLPVTAAANREIPQDWRDCLASGRQITRVNSGTGHSYGCAASVDFSRVASEGRSNSARD